MNKTYTETFCVRGTECDAYDRMRLDALFLNMQEFGETHARQLGLGYDAMLSRGLFFVLSRVHVRIFKPLRSGQRVVHTTWPGVSNRFFCPRFHEFRSEDGTLLAAAGALWVVLDTEKRSIVSPLKAALPFPDNSDIPAPIALPNRLPVLHADAMQTSRTPVYSDFDVNKHVNNTKYIAWLCDSLGLKTFEDAYISELTAGYEKEIRHSDPLDLAVSLHGDDFTFCVSSSGERNFVAGGTLSKEV